MRDRGDHRSFSRATVVALLAALLLAACGGGATAPAGGGTAAPTAGGTSPPVTGATTAPVAEVTGVATTAAAPPPATPAATATPPATVRRGGAVTVGLFQEPTTVNNYFSTKSVDGYVANLVVEALLAVDPAGERLPVLAAAVPSPENGGVSPDGKTVTYTLRPGVRWSDGHPFTSADVKFTYEMLLNRANPVVARGLYERLASVETPDPATVVVVWKEFYAPYLSLFDGGILPKHVFGGNSDISKSGYDRKPVGTGPFVVTDWAAGSVTLGRNPNYRDANKPHLDRIVFTVVPGPDAAIEQLRAGRMDVVLNLREDQVEALEKANDPAVKLLLSPSPSVERLVLNLARPGDPADPAVPHPVLGDARVRQALELATPRREIVERLIGGGKAAVAGTTLPLGWAANPAIEPGDYNLDRARQLLDEAGWRPARDGTREKEGQRLQLSISSTPEKPRSLVTRLLAERWREIGVQLEVKAEPAAVLLGPWRENGLRARGNFDILLYAASAGSDPQNDFFNRYHSRNIPTAANNGAGSNFNRLQDPDLDRLLEAAGATTDRARRKELYGQINQRLNASHANIWLYARSSVDAYRRDVGGLLPNPWNGATFNTEDWYLAR